MKIVLFYQSLISDWNHGNAHFLRGIATELIIRGHEVEIYEPADSWSYLNLVKDYGSDPIKEFEEQYPLLSSHRYTRLDLTSALAGADLIIVHEWNTHELVRSIGKHRPTNCVLLFHDTHHRSVTSPEAMADYDLSHYDGVLAYGNVLRDIYLQRGWTRRAWTWHEAADTTRFRPQLPGGPRSDLVWIGNWGDGERTAELEKFFIQPVRDLGIKACAYGVRYPREAQESLAAAGIEYRGWLPNYRVPDIFAGFRATIHIPRRPYATCLQGIPTIRPFEALACGIPLVVANWSDRDGIFSEGRDFLVARNGEEMARHLATILRNPGAAHILASHGLKTIRSRHTCMHRVDELLAIHQEATTIYA